LIFFDHIGTRISRLAKAYKNAFDDIQDMKRIKPKYLRRQSINKKAFVFQQRLFSNNLSDFIN